MNPTGKQFYVLLAALAVAAWLVPWLLLGRREAWDDPSHFLASIPLMSAAAAYAGYRAKTAAWRWPLTLILAQFAAAVVTTQEVVIVALPVFALLALPMMAAAALGAWLGRRRAAA